jgi:lipocalin
MKRSCDYDVIVTGAGIAGMVSAVTANVPGKRVAVVDIQRFMGDWYVIANIPTWIEKGAHNAVESYSALSASWAAISTSTGATRGVPVRA